ncbi:MAG: ATP-binding protein [Anaerolineales bacterium]
MKQLVILSGKGGTGKTSIAGALSQLVNENGGRKSIVIADADVDAANLELILSPRYTQREDFWSGKIAAIDQELCESCGECVQVCRFDAINEASDGYSVDPFACEGCAACFYVCPSEAVTMKDQLAGAWFRSDSRYGLLYHAALRPAQENSGKLVTLLKQRAKQRALDEKCDLLIVDGPPGIGCPVISALSGADVALIVAEPSKAGVHDMHRIVDTADHFGLPCVVCVNKTDLSVEGSREIEDYCRDKGVKQVGAIPFDIDVPCAMAQGQTVIAYRPDGPASLAIREMWRRIEAVLWGPE